MRYEGQRCPRCGEMAAIGIPETPRDRLIPPPDGAQVHFRCPNGCQISPHELLEAFPKAHRDADAVD